MPNPKFVHLIWNGTQQHSVVAASTIVSGGLQVGEEVGAKWRGKSYSARVLAIGMYMVFITKNHNQTITQLQVMTSVHWSLL